MGISRRRILSWDRVFPLMLMRSTYTGAFGDVEGEVHRRRARQRLRRGMTSAAARPIVL